MKRLKGKVAIITGAAKPDGIGFAACRKLAMAGAEIVVTDLADFESDLKARVKELTSLGAKAIYCTLDVSDVAQVSSAVGIACGTFGGVDIVFNNAGYPGGRGDFMDISNAAWSRSWEVNVMGVLNMCRELIPVMRQRGGGAIINNSSLSGLGVEAGLSAYSASKHAVISLTKSVAIEHGVDNIRANAVCPGLVATQMGDLVVDLYKEPGDSYSISKRRLSETVPLGQRWATPDEVGDAVVYLASDESRYVTGVALPVAGGLVAGL